MEDAQIQHPCLPDSPYGLYIHIPFCKSRCPYCQFVSTTASAHLIARYLSAVRSEYDRRAPHAPATVYIGGGTPSLIPPEALSELLNAIQSSNVTELTIEANPESLTDEWLEAAVSGGCNRLSIGIQSLNDDELQRLGRLHTAGEALSAISCAEQAGITNLSVDLMYGIPGQTVESFQATLEQICANEPSHLSAYALSIEQDTAYAAWSEAGGMELPSADLVADKYRMMNEVTGAAGYVRYELSNFARPGYECRHNLAYWDGTPYIGIGAAAHSFAADCRSWNEWDTGGYITAIEQGSDACIGCEPITESIRLTERIMLSLRTAHGLDPALYQNLGEPFSTDIERFTGRMIDQGLLFETAQGTVAFTIDGAMLADEIIAEILMLLP